MFSNIKGLLLCILTFLYAVGLTNFLTNKYSKSTDSIKTFTTQAQSIPPSKSSGIILYSSGTGTLFTFPENGYAITNRNNSFTISTVSGVTSITGLTGNKIEYCATPFITKSNK